jgi:serine/threonine protein kinase
MFPDLEDALAAVAADPGNAALVEVAAIALYRAHPDPAATAEVLARFPDTSPAAAAAVELHYRRLYERMHDRSITGGSHPDRSALVREESADVILPTGDAVVTAGIRLVEKLGRGGFGDVWRGESLLVGPKTSLAVKLFRNRCVPGAAAVADRLREVQTLFGLRHPNVVQVYGAAHSKWHGTFVAMEYVPGCDLGAWIKQHGAAARADPAHAKRAAAAVAVLARALNAVHERGITHNDVKPGNVLGCRGTTLDPAELKIADFGLAEFAADPIPDAGGETVAAGGTLPYMAPEQFTDGGSAAADVFGLGMTMLHLVTGSLAIDPADPSPGVQCLTANDRARIADVRERYRHLKATAHPDVEALALRLRAEYADVIAGLRRTVLTPTGESPVADPVLRSIIAKCIANDLAARYQSAEQLAADLELYVKDFPAPASGYRYRTFEKVRLFFARCRRPDPLYDSDRGSLWRLTFLMLAPAIELFCIVATLMTFDGMSEQTAGILGSGLTLVGFLVAFAFLWKIGLMKRQVLQTAASVVIFSFCAYTVQFSVLKDDYARLTPVLFVMFTMLIMVAGVIGTDWKLPWYVQGILCTSAVAVCAIWTAYPNTMRPWGHLLIGSSYALYCFLQGLCGGYDSLDPAVAWRVRNPKRWISTGFSAIY